MFRYLATTSSDKTVKLWNVEENFMLSKTLVGHQRWVWDCAFSADSAYVANSLLPSEEDKFLREEILKKCAALPGSPLWSLCRRYLVTASSDKTARLWDLETGDAILEYAGHGKALTCVALNDASM